MSQNLVKLRCEDCGGTMMIDEGKEVLSCPYCGSKKIIFESDEVKIERIKSKNVEVHEANETKREFIKAIFGNDTVMIIFVLILLFGFMSIMLLITSIFN